MMVFLIEKFTYGSQLQYLCIVEVTLEGRKIRCNLGFGDCSPQWWWLCVVRILHWCKWKQTLQSLKPIDSRKQIQSSGIHIWVLMQALYEARYISHIMPVFVPHNIYACSTCVQSV